MPTSKVPVHFALSRDLVLNLFLCRGAWWLSIHSNKPVRRFLFNYLSPASIQALGVFHASSLPFTWHNPIGSIYPSSFTPEEHELASTITQLWGKFMTGQLSSEDWPSYSSESETTLVFGERNTTKVHSISNYKIEVCNWWNATYPTYVFKICWLYLALSVFLSGIPVIEVHVLEQERFPGWVLNEGFWFLLHKIVIVLSVIGIALISCIAWCCWRCICRRRLESPAKLKRD